MIRHIKDDKIVERVTSMVMKGNAYKILVGIFEGKRLVQMSRCRFEVNIKKVIRIRMLRDRLTSSGS
jgi:hypothetical protein